MLWLYLSERMVDCRRCSGIPLQRKNTMQIERQRFLVTGGCGFIGSRVVRLLATRGAEVTVFDRLIRPEVRDELPPSAAARVTLQEGDITSATEVQAAAHGAAGVFHLAVLDLNSCTDDPRLCVRINIEGTYTVLEAAQRAGLSKVVFSSASSVYGDTDETMDESHPLGARTIYGASKIAGEYFCRSFHTMFDLDYVVLRYMNVYGPHQTIGVIPAVLGRIRAGQAPVIFGKGTQSFDFIYVDDVAEANLRAMASDTTDEAFNVGSGEERSIKQVVETLLRLTGSDVQPDYQPAPVGQMQRRVGSSTKAEHLLGWRAAIPFDEGLCRVVTAG